MSTFGDNRPRRAALPDEIAEADDTSGLLGSARRAAMDDDSSEEVVFSEDPAPARGTGASPAPRGNAPEDLYRGHDDTPTMVNPFARPGSANAQQSLDTPVPAPVMPGRSSESSLQTPIARRMGPPAEGPTPAPRRSAVSPNTPAEPEVRRMGPAQARPSTGARVEPPAKPKSWLKVYGRRLALVLVVALLLAALIFTVIFYSIRNVPQPVDPSPGDSNSEAPSPIAPDELGKDASKYLFSMEQIQQVAPDDTWVEVATADEPQKISYRPNCLDSDPRDINTLKTVQRSFATTESTKLGAIHQIDLYASPEAAEQVMNARVASLALCKQVPAYLKTGHWIDNLGDQATGVTVVYENDPRTYHTILLVRTGAALTIIDLSRDEEAVPMDNIAQQLKAPLTSLCEGGNGNCPGDVKVGDTLPPPADPTGWLIPSDFQRVRPGYGTWTASQPQGVSDYRGTGCENLPLATEPGPYERMKREYLLTADDQKPDTFGVDELRLKFQEPDKATEFRDRLHANLRTCSERSETASVNETAGPEYGDGKGAMFRITHQSGENTTVPYDVFVGVQGDEVIYLLITGTDDFNFNDEQRTELAKRALGRATQD